MKRYSKALSSIALLLAMILCLSGCSVIDYARSAIKRDPVTSEIVTEIVGGAENIVPNNNTQATQSVVVTTQKGTSAQSTTKPSTTAGSGTTATTKPTEGTTAGTTQAPIIDESTSVEDIKDMPVKEVQDILFATDDEATARKILLAAGFEYDEAQGIYYSQMNPLQRKFGFNFVYDMAAPLTGMYYSTKRIEFEYAGKEWMVQIWKGQYGITAGAEIGLYSRDPSKVMQYDCADDAELIEMQFDFYNMGEYVFSRGPEKHWWLTGFKVAHIGVPYFIEMDMTLNFEDNQMANAFVAALKKQAMTDPLDPMTYTRNGSKINIIW